MCTLSTAEFLQINTIFVEDRLHLGHLSKLIDFGVLHADDRTFCPVRRGSWKPRVSPALIAGASPISQGHL